MRNTEGNGMSDQSLNDVEIKHEENPMSDLRIRNRRSENLEINTGKMKCHCAVPANETSL